MNNQNTEIKSLELKSKYLGEVDIDSIEESKANPRRTFRKEELEELSQSIARSGVLQPVMVRKLGKGFELIAGARRVRASRLAGLTTIPAVEVACDEETAGELRIVENCQRVDVHPMEEAEAIEKLIEFERKRDPRGDHIGAVAQRMGKPRGHVARRMRFLELPREARKMFLSGGMSAEHALVIARLSTLEMREKAFKLLVEGRPWQEGQLSAAEFAKEVDEEILLDLETAGFDTADASLVPTAGACGPCPKRTGNATDLFGGVADADVCTDSACFKLKLDAAWERRKAAATESGETIISEKDRKKVLRNDWPIHGSGYQKVEEQKLLKSLKKLEAKPAIVRTDDGRILELWKEKDVLRASRGTSKESNRRSEEEVEADKKLKAQEKAKRAREALEEEADKRILAEAIERAGNLSDSAFVLLMWKLHVRASDWLIRGIADRKKVKVSDLLKTTDAKERKRVIAEILVDDFAGYSTDVNAFLEAVGGKVDRKAMIAKIKKEREEVKK